MKNPSDGWRYVQGGGMAPHILKADGTVRVYFRYPNERNFAPFTLAWESGDRAFGFAGPGSHTTGIFTPAPEGSDYPSLLMIDRMSWTFVRGGEKRHIGTGVRFADRAEQDRVLSDMFAAVPHLRIRNLAGGIDGNGLCLSDAFRRGVNKGEFIDG